MPIIRNADLKSKQIKEVIVLYGVGDALLYSRASQTFFVLRPHFKK